MSVVDVDNKYFIRRLKFTAVNIITRVKKNFSFYFTFRMGIGIGKRLDGKKRTATNPSTKGGQRYPRGRYYQERGGVR